MPDLFRKDKIKWMKVLEKMPSPENNISRRESRGILRYNSCSRAFPSCLSQCPRNVFLTHWYNYLTKFVTRHVLGLQNGHLLKTDHDCKHCEHTNKSWGCNIKKDRQTCSVRSKLLKVTGIQDYRYNPQTTAPHNPLWRTDSMELLYEAQSGYGYRKAAWKGPTVDGPSTTQAWQASTQTHLIYLKHVKIGTELLYPSRLQKLENENEERKFNWVSDLNDWHFKHTSLIRAEYKMEQIEISTELSTMIHRFIICAVQGGNH